MKFQNQRYMASKSQITTPLSSRAKASNPHSQLETTSEEIAHKTETKIIPPTSSLLLMLIRKATLLSRKQMNDNFGETFTNYRSTIKGSLLRVIQQPVQQESRCI